MSDSSGTPTRYGRDTFDRFTIRRWKWRSADATAELHYDLGPHHFIEEVCFGVAGQPPEPLLDVLAVVAGTSYFKAAAPRRIRSDIGLFDSGVDLMRAAYDEGLREFAYRNAIDVPLISDLDVERLEPADGRERSTATRLLVTLGGGRDSALTAAALRSFDMELMTAGTNEYADRVGAVLGRAVHHGGRVIAPELITLNSGPALNGHVPVTGINSLVAACSAALLGCTHVVMSNEASANRASHVVDGTYEINHQYSKSWEFERLLTAALADAAGLGYFSAIRPWGELAVARAFAAVPELHTAIMSCNRAFIRDPARRSTGWCGECDKCRFVFLSLAPFMTPEALGAMFGSDLLAADDPVTVDGFAALFATTERPWDCVGEPEEARAALGLLLCDDRWCRHAVVRALAERLGPPPVDDLAGLLAPHGAHGIPGEFWPSMSAAFA